MCWKTLFFAGFNCVLAVFTMNANVLRFGVVADFKALHFQFIAKFHIGTIFYLLLSPALRIAFEQPVLFLQLLVIQFYFFRIALLISYSAIPILCHSPCIFCNYFRFRFTQQQSNSCFSASVFKISSIADKYKFILPANSALNQLLDTVPKVCVRIFSIFDFKPIKQFKIKILKFTQPQVSKILKIFYKKKTIKHNLKLSLEALMKLSVRFTKTRFPTIVMVSVTVKHLVINGCLNPNTSHT